MCFRRGERPNVVAVGTAVAVAAPVVGIIVGITVVVAVPIVVIVVVPPRFLRTINIFAGSTIEARSSCEISRILDY